MRKPAQGCELPGATATDLNANPQPITIVRLERSNEGARVFWEITRKRTLVTTQAGVCLGVARRKNGKKTFASELEAETAFDRAIEEKKREGYREPVVRTEVGSSSRPGVIARDAELEAMIEEAPHEADRYLVYADWLQQAGDVRGELIVLQHQLATSSGLDGIFALEHDQATLFRRYDAELLGPLAHVSTAEVGQASPTWGYSWRHGFVRTALLSRLWRTRVLGDVLSGILAHPSLRFLERLICVLDNDEAADGLFRTLRHAAPRTLDTLVIERMGARIDGLWAALPGLKHLEVARLRGGLGATDLPVLESVRTHQADHDVLDAIGRTRLPSLKRLHLTLPFRSSEVHVAGILASASVPKLAYVAVRRWVQQGIQEQDALAVTVASAAAARRLPRLDLEMVIGREGVRALVERAGDLGRIGALHLSRDAIDEALHGPLESALPNLVWTDTVEEAERVALDELDREPDQPVWRRFGP